MRVSDYSYKLPKDKIAQHPPGVRGQSRLLVLDRAQGGLVDRQYRDVGEYLLPGDVLVINDTRVIKARLIALDTDNKAVELVLLEKHGRHEDRHRHKVLYRGRLGVKDILKVGAEELRVEAVEEGGIAVVTSVGDIENLSATQGKVPLPPYMKREASVEDEQRYQTVFAREKGSVAAPTASLNMTNQLLGELEAKGVQVATLTLHVGLGTFLPIRSDEVKGHTMHSEYFVVPTETASLVRDAKQKGGRVVALGTTVARTLEYAQQDILAGSTKGRAITGEADIFIYPGYEFKVVDALITNFHAPKSTVLMLAAAFAGWDNLSHAYQHALEQDYTFLSYGDSMLIL
jgi:S-adenosylmethionine:tRNA ribosyltransferase-isomerase